MKNFRVVVNGMEYQVGIEEILGEGTSTPIVREPIKTAPKPTPTPVKAAPTKATAAPMQEGEGAIAAPMPGTIINVNKNKGDKVAKGDLLLVLEAMKMENEIMAPCDGTVANIHVTSGASVNAGDVLIEIS